MQPGKAVRPGDRQHPTVGQVDCGQTLDQEPLLAQGIAIVRGNRAINTLTGHGSRPAQQRAGRRDGNFAVGVACRLVLAHPHVVSDWVAPAEHAAHHPCIAMCFTSATKPWRVKRFPTNESAVATALSITAPHDRHTRWMWSAWSER